MRLKRRDLSRNRQLWQSSDGAKRDPRGASLCEDAPHQHRRVGGRPQLLPLLLRPASATEPDLVFGAFQTDFYLTAFGIAINRIELKEDPKAMTLLASFIPAGSVCRKTTATPPSGTSSPTDHGDREATFALAMFRLQGAPRISCLVRDVDRCNPVRSRVHRRLGRIIARGLCWVGVKQQHCKRSSSTPS